MKYAFILGSNIFITTHRTVSYADANTKVQFLKIQSFFAAGNHTPGHVLLVDVSINTPKGEKVMLNSNEPIAGTVIETKLTDNRLQLFNANHAEPLLDVYQLAEHEYKHLSSHIVNEIEAQHVEVVITLKGDFKVDGHHIVIDNERLYVNGDAFANGVFNAHEGVELKPDVKD